jgi:hypothetical protein
MSTQTGRSLKKNEHDMCGLGKTAGVYENLLVMSKKEIEVAHTPLEVNDPNLRYQSMLHEARA